METATVGSQTRRGADPVAGASRNGALLERACASKRAHDKIQRDRDRRLHGTERAPRHAELALVDLGDGVDLDVLLPQQRTRIERHGDASPGSLEPTGACETAV